MPTDWKEINKVSDKKFIQTGTGTGAASTTQVTFPVPFDHAPRVVATAASSTSYPVVGVGIIAVDSGGFSFQTTINGAKAAAGIYWIAIDPSFDS